MDSISRRQFLDKSRKAAEGSALAAVARSLLAGAAGAAGTAVALGAPVANSPRRYVNIQLFSAPARWTFDLLLNPLQDSAFRANPHVVTTMRRANGKLVGAYETIELNGLHVPPLWGTQVPEPGGGTRPLSDLLSHLLHIRGVNTNNAGHTESARLHFRPSGAAVSLTGLSGVSDEYAFPAVAYEAIEYIYGSSRLGQTPTFLVAGGATNPISALLKPFVLDRVRGGVLTDPAMASLIKTSWRSILERQDEAAGGPTALTGGRRQTMQLLEWNMEAFIASWPERLARYAGLVSRSIAASATLAGVMDEPVITAEAGTKSNDLMGTLLTTSDMRSIFTPVAGASLVAFRMAEQFAAAEFILLESLSPSVTISPRSFLGLNRNGVNQGELGFDEHEMGWPLSLMINTRYFHAFATCLSELIARTKSKGLFEETVINVASEFNRSPRPDGTGSDHAFRAASVALFSGAISGPLVVGNIRGFAPQYANAGTFGEGAPLGNGEGHLTMGHLASTIATVLRAPSPVTSAPSLVILENDRVKSLSPTGRVV